MNNFDEILKNSMCAAICSQERLTPVDGTTVMPPVYAPDNRDGFPGGFAITALGGDPPTNRVILDSKASIANRLEPIFAGERYSGLVPRGSLDMADGGDPIDSLQLTHRAGDPLLFHSDIGERVTTAARALRDGNHEPLAKLHPTTYVFGTSFRRPFRADWGALLSGSVDAHDVVEMSSRSQSIGSESNRLRAAVHGEGKPNDKIGDLDSAGSEGGGVIVRGEIVRALTLVLSQIRLLKAPDAERTAKLQRYVFGLALVAFTAPHPAQLRKGCTLIELPGSLRVWAAVRRAPDVELEISHEQAIEYARSAAADFGVGEDWTAKLDAASLRKELNGRGRKAVA